MQTTHKGEFMGIASTGKRVKSRGIFIVRIADGKFVQSWIAFDNLGLMPR